MKGSRQVKRTARRLYRLCLVDGALDPGRVRLVAQRLAASNRRGALTILAGFQRLVRLDTDRHTAVVESATPLEDTVRSQVRADVARRYGPRIETSFVENAALIGGMRIKVGSDVYGGSVRARLASLEARL
jgi:F-type H+-transporting ATPase subunit delta